MSYQKQWPAKAQSACISVDFGMSSTSSDHRASTSVSGTGVESAQSITIALKGKWYGSYGQACCPAHDDKNPSLTLADGTDGRLLLHCKAGCSFIDVLQALGLNNQNRAYQPKPLDPAKIERRQAAAKEKSRQAERKARVIWSEALPILGTIAETYLQGRGITCALPDSLRFHPHCRHPSGCRLPAMIARIDGLPRLAIHRTFLRDDGHGKSEIAPSKAMLGTTIGGAVRLSDSMRPLVVAEGIETALSLPCGLLCGPVSIWAALSASGMTNLHLPESPHRLIIASDGDRPGHQAAQRLAERATARGWQVSLLPAPDGCDWNDVLNGEGEWL